jgi:hypothetical protein
MGMEQVNQQQLAVAISQSAATENIEALFRKVFEGQVDTDNGSKIKESEESVLKKALDNKPGDRGIEIISGLVLKLSQNLTTDKLMNRLKDDYGFVLDPKDEGKTDSIEIQSPIARAAKTLNQQKEGSHSFLGGDDGATGQQADLKEYIGAYSQVLINGGGEAKKKLEQIEKRLLSEKGVELKNLQSVKAQVANSVRGEILGQLKDSYLKHLVAQTKSLDWLITRQEGQKTIDYAFNNAALGGFDFGGFFGDLQGAMNQVHQETHATIRDLMVDELNEKFIKLSMGDKTKDTEKEILQLLKVGEKIGFDIEQFLKKLPQLKEDLGLNLNYDLTALPNNANSGNQEQSGEQRRQSYRYTQDEEKEVLTDKLRALYMRRAMNGDLRTVVETQFKMIKTKNGLIKLGVSNFEQIEAEGRALAKIKLFEMLREAFEERATYAKLTGEAWKMTERKIKTVLRNLENLGLALGDVELEQIRDRANEKMFREAEHEYSLINTAIEAQGEYAYLLEKRKMVSEIMERLATETGFKAPGHELELAVREAC